MRDPSRVVVGALIGLGLFVSACSGSADDASRAEGSGNGSDTVAEPDAAVDAELSAGIVGLDGNVVLHPPNSGDRPELSWDPVDGATSYVVTVSLSDGTPYWAWETEETSVLVGITDRPDAAPGARVTSDMAWWVVARNADGGAIASSARQPFD